MGYLNDTYVEEKFINYFAKNLPSYVTGDDAWAINWNPNGVFERPDDLYWLNIWFLSNPPTQQELGTNGRNRWTGAVVIHICVPRDEYKIEVDENGNYSSVSAMNTCFNDVAKVFKRGLTFDGIRINKTYRNPSAMQVEEDFCWMPVTIEWIADLDN